MFININSINFASTIETMIKHGEVFVNDWSDEAFEVLESMAQTENKSIFMVEQDDHQHQVAVYLTNNSFAQWKFYNEKKVVTVYGY